MTRRAKLAALAAFFMACAAYGSVVPFRWRDIGWLEGLSLFSRMPFRPLEHLGSGDVFTNILVFLPIGFFGVGAVKGGTKVPPARSHVPSGQSVTGGTCGPDFSPALLLFFLAACALFSTLLELGQIYIAARTPSWSDIFAQTLGAILGVVAWLAVGERAIAWSMRPLRAATREERLYQLLLLYAAGWLVLSVLPLFFPRLAHPQLELWRARMDFSRLTLAGPIVIAGLSAVPLGILGALSTPSRRAPSLRGAAAALIGPVLLIAVDRFRQVGFIPTDGHLAASLVGFAAGWIVMSPLGTRIRQEVTAYAAWWRGAALVALTALLALHYWAPFNFGVRPSALGFRIRILYERAPFHRYYWTPPLIALGEVVTLLMLGALFSALLRVVPAGPRRLSPPSCVAITATVFAFVEWGQLHLPARRADPTDVMIAVLGAIAGAALATSTAAPPGRASVGSST